MKIFFFKCFNFLKLKLDFSKMIISTFELDDIKKQMFLKENWIDQSKTICSICGFLLNVEGEGWFDFALKCEHLFLRNIYTFDDLKKNGNWNWGEVQWHYL